MLAIVLAASVAACVPPVKPPPGSHATYYTDILPPARWRKLGEVIVVTHHAKDIPAICDEGPPTCGYVTEACTMGTGPGAVVHMPDPCAPEFRGQSFARLFCHEASGHALGGWPAYHGD